MDLTPFLGLFGIDWSNLFAPTLPIAEILTRGTVIYLVIFTLLRVISKRQAGSVGISDLLLIVLLADASQNGMAGDYESITDAIILVSTIIFWDYVLNWLGYHSPKIQLFVYPPPRVLIKNGFIVYRNLKKELLTEAELMSQLRQHGVREVSEVREAYIESNGNVSVLLFESRHDAAQ